MELPYPFILGNGVAGVVEDVGPSVTRFAKGDRVVSDTPSYRAKEPKYGGWQKYVVSREATTAKIPTSTTFEDAIATPFALLTAVAALHLSLGMDKPGAKRTGKTLIWGASGSVGGYAVQYASGVSGFAITIHQNKTHSYQQVGYEVIATASPKKFDYVRGLGASEVLDYKDDQIVSSLQRLGPYDFVLLASGDAKGVNAISDILQPRGGTFATTRPKSDDMNLAGNVNLVYDYFSMATQKPENADFAKWWYQNYLPTALAGNVTPTPLEKRSGGLAGIQQACEDVIKGVSSKKLVLNIQEYSTIQ